MVRIIIALFQPDVHSLTTGLLLEKSRGFLDQVVKSGAPVDKLQKFNRNLTFQLRSFLRNARADYLYFLFHMSPFLDFLNSGLSA
jgi:hypothetical protein